MTILDEMLDGYVTAALWSTNDESNEYGGEPLDANYTTDDIAPETLEQMRKDCQAFIIDNAEDIGAFMALTGRPWDHIGHDYWLTRNGRGVGFWDRGAGAVGDRLSDACRNSEVHLYVGDDGKIYS